MSKEFCPFCDGTNLSVVDSHAQHEIDGQQVKVAVRSHACGDCGAVFGNGADMRFNARAMRAETKRVRRLLTGLEVRAVRERLGLTQAKAAELFGGGPVAFSKYESDDVAQSDAMNLVLRLADLHPHLLADIAHIQGVEFEPLKTSFAAVNQIFVNARWSSAQLGRSFDSIVMSEASNSQIFYDANASDVSPVPRDRVAA